MAYAPGTFAEREFQEQMKNASPRPSLEETLQRFRRLRGSPPETSPRTSPRSPLRAPPSLTSTEELPLHRSPLRTSPVRSPLRTSPLRSPLRASPSLEELPLHRSPLRTSPLRSPRALVPVPPPTLTRMVVESPRTPPAYSPPRVAPPAPRASRVRPRHFDEIDGSKLSVMAVPPLPPGMEELVFTTRVRRHVSPGRCIREE